MLQLNNVSVSVADRVIVDHVSLSLKPGEIYALMGPNGSGKSSLAQALAGHPFYHLNGDSQCQLNKRDLLALSPNDRAAQGLFLAFQYPLSVPGVSVYNFLKIASESLHCATCPDHQKCPRVSITEFRLKVNKLAKLIDLSPELLQRSLNDGFSGGEKKRLEVLQALLFKPHYAIFDETDSGLDVDSIKLIAKSIRALAKTHHTGCLIITHYQRLLEYLKPDKASVMVKGKIVATDGSTLLKKIDQSGYKPYLKKRA